MQLPKYKKKKRVKLKKCQEPGCNREFWGHPIAKYCDLHKDIKARQKPKKIISNFELNNMYLKHSYNSSVEVKFKCCLDGCDNVYSIKLFPKQYVYPRFCLEHRNDFKRNNYLRTQKNSNN